MTIQYTSVTLMSSYNPNIGNAMNNIIFMASQGMAQNITITWTANNAQPPLHGAVLYIFSILCFLFLSVRDSMLTQSSMDVVYRISVRDSMLTLSSMDVVYRISVRDSMLTQSSMDVVYRISVRDPMLTQSSMDIVYRISAMLTQSSMDVVYRISAMLTQSSMDVVYHISNYKNVSLKCYLRKTNLKYYLRKTKNETIHEVFWPENISLSGSSYWLLGWK